MARSEGLGRGGLEDIFGTSYRYGTCEKRLCLEMSWNHGETVKTPTYWE